MSSCYVCIVITSACLQITKKVCEEAGVKTLLLPGDLASEIVCKYGSARSQLPEAILQSSCVLLSESMRPFDCTA